MVSIDWFQLYSWPGYDFWGILLSLIGSLLSIVFAWKASSRAGIAAEAARAARKSMEVADTSTSLSLVQQILVEIRLRVENQQWEQVAEKCESVRVVVAPLISSDRVLLSEEIGKSLIGLQSQMASLQKTADEVRHNEKEFDLVKINGVLSRQAEAVARAIRELRDHTEVVINV